MSRPNRNRAAPWTVPAAAVLAAAVLAATGIAAAVAACDGAQGPPRADGESAAQAAPATQPRAALDEQRDALPRPDDVDIPTVRYAWDPQAGDPDVPAELGGPGFSGEGWETRLDFLALGSSEAVRGGTITMHLPDWPATLRLCGQNYNTTFNVRAADLCFERLLLLHPITMEYVPHLATHWQIADDGLTYRFRINPEARWNDGEEVTSEDVVATWRLKVDPQTLDPTGPLTYGKLEEPVALSKYVVEVRAKERNWRNFLYFATSLHVLPAHEISIGGEEYLDRYQFAHTASSGPYEMLADDVVRNQSITFRRRDDWWGAKNPAWTGLWNFDAYRFLVVKDWSLAFEKVKKGELDYSLVLSAQWWSEELPKLDVVQRGLLVPRKFYNDAPVGTTGIACNMRRPPLDDVRVRKALAHLFDRATFNEKLFGGEYPPLDSYWQSATYRNPQNSPVAFDPFEAVRLLAEAGYDEIGSDGVRVRAGRRLALELIYLVKASERHLTIFQEDCRDAGIELSLRFVDSSEHWKAIQKREFELADVAWGALLVPNPETSYGSRQARGTDNNNITGVADERIDALLAEYDRESDVAGRQAIVRAIDAILFEMHPYVLAWYAPARRVMFWNKFGMPPWGTWRFVREGELMYSWWVDPERAAQLERARVDPSITLDAPEPEHRFWAAWNQAQRER